VLVVVVDDWHRRLDLLRLLAPRPGVFLVVVPVILAVLLFALKPEVSVRI
jgi:hypothetical protein